MSVTDYSDADRAVDEFCAKYGMIFGWQRRLRAIVHGLLDAERAKQDAQRLFAARDIDRLTSELATVRAELETVQNSERRWYVEAHETLDTRSLRLIVQRDKALEQLASAEAENARLRSGWTRADLHDRALADLQAALDVSEDTIAESFRIVVALTKQRDEIREEVANWRKVSAINGDTIATLTAERDRAVTLLIEHETSIHPHPVEHPTIFAWCERIDDYLKELDAKKKEKT